MRVFKFEEIDSTNKYLKSRKELKNYDCVIAQTQTAGVGRRGNIWVSNMGMALFSFALQEDRSKEIEEYKRLPLIVGISVLSALKKIEDLDYKFKWTNDIYLEDKKLSGVLVEKIDDFFIIGIGININNLDFGYAQESAISLKKVTNRHYIIDDVIYCIINEFKLYLEKEWTEILEEIEHYDYLLNRQIEVINDGKSLGVGIATGIDRDGKLSVNIAGESLKFDIGEIHIKK